ncbi:MAG: hypothetical protein GY829_06725, partial [Gammaproteobacteria bacterium]|nr:hypothetical protein [Gammaproteobacteria bacterium]
MQPNNHYKTNRLTAQLKILCSVFLFSLIPHSINAATLTITDKFQKPLANVMVMQTPVSGYTLDISDMGYPPERKLNRANTVYTAFSDEKGNVEFTTYLDKKTRIRLRLPEHEDVNIEMIENENKSIIMKPIVDSLLLAESRPANTWLAILNLENDAYLKKHYIMQCGFCHQQGSRFFRRPRPKENWEEVIYRMIGYGSRLHDEAQELLPEVLASEYGRLFENPHLIPKGTPWDNYLQHTKITEWPIGDSFSQMHDLLYHSNGMVYIGDNLQDRMYELNPRTGEYTLYKLKRESSDTHGGIMGKRLSSFPKHDTFAGIHSLAESPIDGHIFITTSHQQRLVEFNPKSKQFTNYEMDDGYYPHTIRVDKKNRVWFTMALSNQIAMFDRHKKEFTMFDLPSRSTKESITISSMGSILTMMDWG